VAVNRSAVLFLDLQHDFLGGAGSRMPVDPAGAAAVLRTANAILDDILLPGALRVLIVNHFPTTQRVANWFRRGAAVTGTPGAALDARLHSPGAARCFPKARPSAFTNPDLECYLRAECVTALYVFGVFAEGCVRATVADARQRGFAVTVLTDAIATDAPWKLRFALWSMRRAGATLLPTAALP
jgi:nicotinamidase-related amidase